MSGVRGRLLAREREEETLHTAPIHTAYVVHGREPGRLLQFAVFAAGREPRITVTADVGGTVVAGGFLHLRDVRRVARALASGAARTRIALHHGGVLPGGWVSVDQDGDDVYLVAAPPDGPPSLYGPLRASAFGAVCRDVVGWTRLLAGDAG